LKDGPGSHPDAGLERSAAILHLFEDSRFRTSEASGMSHEILIVEDDSALREALAQVLSDEGYELLTARDGLEAVNCLKMGNRPDVILLDLSMPVVNGWEFRMFQKRDPELATIPVILITAGGYSREEVAWLEPSALIAKPIDLDLLLADIRRFCAGSGEAEQSE
jgi:CheY-like chemotaxis protein